ncbi:hypothetical protein L1887_03048 [Cichorium endivia]|nr:hypothetical protein L1887_03048 [Cichorium endivia]
MKSLLLLLTLCFTFLISHGLAQTSPSISPRHSNFDDNKESLLQCWSALFDLGYCYGDLLRAAESGKVDLSIEPTCCQAGRSMNSGCWPKMFPYNPFFPRFLQAYCLSFPLAPPPPSDGHSRTPDLQKPSMASPTPTPLNTDVPSPSAEGPSMASPSPANADAPTPNGGGPILHAPVALPPYAPSPTIDQGPSMDTSSGEGPAGQPWIHF